MSSGSRPSTPALHPWTTHFFIGLVAAAGLMLLLQAIPATREVVQSIDDAVHDFFVEIRVDAVTFLADALDIIGSSFVTIPLRIAVAVLLIVRRHWWLLGAFLLAVTLGEVLNSTLKWAYARPRPPDPMVGVSNNAFPSGHTMAAAVISVIIVLILVAPGPRRRAWMLGAVAITLLMGLSRVYLSAHWLTDTMAGAFLGAAVAVGSVLGVQWLHDRQAGPTEPDPGPLDKAPGRESREAPELL